MKNSIHMSNVRKDVATYLSRHFGGKVLYIPIPNQDSVRRTKKQTIELLKKALYTDIEICKCMNIYPSELNRLMR